jgi:hypothetical protein
MSHRILWTALSRFHDWSDKKLPARLLDRALAANALAPPVEWIAVKEGKRRRVRITESDQLAARVLDFATPDPKHKIISLEAGGSSPAPWTFTAHLPPFVAADQRVWGYGVVSLLFDGSPFATAQRSAALINAFLHTHAPEDTEYACIHPYARLQILRNTTFKIPVTFTPMLAGIYWANFLGPGQLEMFDSNRLRGLKARRVRWVDDRGLFVVVSSNISDAESPETERKMEQLTVLFRNALK